MLTLQEAKQLVHKDINAFASQQADAEELVILDGLTIEKPWGWVFFYNSKRFVETEDPMDSLAGNAPYLVNKFTGEIFVTGTAYETEHYIERYEKTGDPNS